MQFLYPNFLWGLFLLAIPLVLHLFYFRRHKRIHFPSVRFLKKVEEDTSIRRKVKNIVLLVIRLFTFAAIILAFAQPFISRNQNVTTEQSYHSIYIDNSFSMQALKDDIPLIDLAKKIAERVVHTAPTGDRFQIITNEMKGRQMRLLDKESSLLSIEEIEISPVTNDLTTILNKQYQVADKNDQKAIIYHISDFQKSNSDPGIYSDTTYRKIIIPVNANSNGNVSIDSVWLESPVQSLNSEQKMFARIHNYSDEKREQIRLSLQLDGRNIPAGTMDIEANSSKIDTLSFSLLKSGWQSGNLSISDYPVQFDDSWHLSFPVRDKIDILILSDQNENRYLNASFRNTPYINITHQLTGQIDFRSIHKYDLVLLNDLPKISSGLKFELSNYLNKGGNVLLFPAADADLTSYNDLYSNTGVSKIQSFQKKELSVGRVNIESAIFRSVFENRSAISRLPVTQGYFTKTRFGNKPEKWLLKFRDGNSAMSSFNVGKGIIYIAYMPLNSEYNNLVVNGEIFIPMLYNMAISQGFTHKLAYTIGEDENVDVNLPEQIEFENLKLTGGETFIPGIGKGDGNTWLELYDQIETPGTYRLFSGTDIIHNYSFNYSRKESDPICYVLADLQNQNSANTEYIELTDFDDIDAQLQISGRGIELWKYFLIAALLLLLTETILLRIWKN